MTHEQILVLAARIEGSLVSQTDFALQREYRQGRYKEEDFTKAWDIAKRKADRILQQRIRRQARRFKEACYE